MTGMLTHWEGQSISSWARSWGVGRVEAHVCLPSTNDRARELSSSEVGGVHVVIAEEQTAGRGRGGRVWESPSGGGLWMSVSLVAAGEPLLLPLLMGVAVARAIERMCPRLAVGTKWPNDVYVGARKVAGILCETRDGRRVVAGVGINVSRERFPPQLSDRATSLVMEGCAVARGPLAGAVVTGFAELAASAPSRLEDGILAEIGRRDTLRGRHVTVGPDPGDPRTTGANTISGMASGIDPTGALLVDVGDPLPRRVQSGSVQVDWGRPGATATRGRLSGEVTGE